MSHRCRNCFELFEGSLPYCPRCSSNRISVISDTINSTLTHLEVIQLSSYQPKPMLRIQTLDYVDAVLGGGLVPGSLILFAGAPGAGKSTLLLQIAKILDQKAFYLSSEESMDQLMQRYSRLGMTQFDRSPIGYESSYIDTLPAHINSLKSRLAIVDSLQTISTHRNFHVSGSVSQLKAVTHDLKKTAHTYSCCIIAVCHVTKKGFTQGPNLLEHLADVVLWLDLNKKSDIRTLRCSKNRFGSTALKRELQMTESGLYSIVD